MEIGKQGCLPSQTFAALCCPTLCTCLSTILVYATVIPYSAGSAWLLNVLLSTPSQRAGVILGKIQTSSCCPLKKKKTLYGSPKQKTLYGSQNARTENSTVLPVPWQIMILASSLFARPLTPGLPTMMETLTSSLLGFVLLQKALCPPVFCFLDFQSCASSS